MALPAGRLSKTPQPHANLRWKQRKKPSFVSKSHNVNMNHNMELRPATNDMASRPSMSDYSTHFSGILL
eukprot:CAMPEP_0202702328 /NCGR_PEP_ID=MMETSP1385-20130828/15343_1 /ASSEMBLY_ACC=CAM_ASM_000861 /TAXON_ID=933848 /ORGANISM="Elphidium margaritaceum" /LENGTH=68 /DNA_ID=CAMNT_0049359961 /DNA_START=30 /DNA_END=232 /DNA_ORIENTATION=+